MKQLMNNHQQFQNSIKIQKKEFSISLKKSLNSTQASIRKIGAQRTSGEYQHTHDEELENYSYSHYLSDFKDSYNYTKFKNPKFRPNLPPLEAFRQE